MKLNYLKIIIIPNQIYTSDTQLSLDPTKTNKFAVPQTFTTTPHPKTGNNFPQQWITRIWELVWKIATPIAYFAGWRWRTVTIKWQPATIPLGIHFSVFLPSSRFAVGGEKEGCLCVCFQWRLLFHYSFTQHDINNLIKISMFILRNHLRKFNFAEGGGNSISFVCFEVFWVLFVKHAHIYSVNYKSVLIEL